MARRLLLDVSSLMYRAFFSIPTSVTGETGQPVNAVHGYLDMCARLAADHRPSGLTHAFDHDWRPAPRVRAYAGYKAARPPDPEGLPEQFDILRAALHALGQPVAEAKGWEAEDAIGSICAAAGARGRSDAVTGDRDLIQLVRDPQVRVLFTLRGVTQLRVLDEAGVQEHYGVPASRYADFATLRGDPSDGLPGVRGVGEVTARSLIQSYPSLEALLEDAASPRRSGAPLQRSPSLRANVLASREYLEAMRLVVPIRTDLKVTSTDLREPNEAALQELSKTHRLGGPVGRLRAALKI
ncbi:MAG TPA: 5'-3' exonuclease [Actinomycetota bacterium]|jgi:5'-3' exonuclease